MVARWVVREGVRRGKGSVEDAERKGEGGRVELIAQCDGFQILG